MTVLTAMAFNHLPTISHTISKFNIPVITRSDNELSLCGNALEVTAAVLVCSSTLWNPNERHSFAGVDGEAFIWNLVTSLLLLAYRRFEFPPKIKFPALDEKNVFDLKAFLSTMRIPFLSGWNNEMPLLESLNQDNSSLGAHFVKLLEEKRSGKPTDGPEFREFFARNFVRTVYGSQIDGRFEAFIGGEFKQVIVECAKYGEVITSAELLEVLQKCLDTADVGLSLVFGKYHSSVAHSSTAEAIITTALDSEQVESELDMYEAQIKV